MGKNIFHFSCEQNKHVFTSVNHHQTFLKVLVLFVTGGLLSMGVYGSINIVQRFDANKMLPVDSYLSKWISITQEYYTGHGFAVSVNTDTKLSIKLLLFLCLSVALYIKMHLKFFKIFCTFIIELRIENSPSKKIP